MIKISDIYVFIAMSLLQFIYTNYDRKNTQHSMLANTINKNIFNYNCYQEILHTFMLSLCVFITGLLTLVYLEVIANTQC